MTRIQQREFNKDSRQDLIVNSVHPVPFFLNSVNLCLHQCESNKLKCMCVSVEGYVDTDLANHEGPLTVAQGTIDQSVALLVIFYFCKYLTDVKLTNTFKLM